MSKGVSICISGDGSKVEAIYSDGLNSLRPLLGKPVIERASTVTYDSDRELWIAKRLDNGEILCENESRDYCIREEVRILSQERQKTL